MKSRHKAVTLHISVLTDIFKKWNRKFSDKNMPYLDEWIKKGLKNVRWVNKII